MKNPRVILFLIVLLTIGIYWQVSHHDFIPYDDDKYVQNNEHVQSGFTRENISWAFTSGHASNWHPLTWLSHTADVQIFGLDPGKHHLVNLVFHCVNIVLLFFVLFRLTGNEWHSLVVAALFALHPLHVESVAWIAERKDVLSMMFFLLTVYAYTVYVQTPSSWRFIVVWIVYALGLMSKPMLVTVPFILLLLDYWPLKRLNMGAAGFSSRISDLSWEKFWLFVLALLSSNITYLVQKAGKAVSTLDSTSLAVRIANALVSYVTYIVKTFVPINLAVFYPHVGETLPLWQVIGSGILLLLITGLAIAKAKNHPYGVVGWLWFVGTLVPVIGLVQVGAQAMADRYMYLPHIGLFIVITWGIAEGFRHVSHSKTILAFSAMVIVATLSFLTWKQTRYWENGRTLFEHTIAVTENNWLAHHNLAWALMKEGHLEDARAHFLKTLELYPSFAVAHYNLGNVLKDETKYEEAIDQYRETLRLDSSLTNAYIDWGVSLTKQGKQVEAIEQYAKAIHADSNLAAAHFNMGLLLAEQGKVHNALHEFEVVVRMNPMDEEAQRELKKLQDRLR
ncbi:MAG: tetratricopeptide repeat protein [Ignavibacteriales bacterium]|nr:tetratricopeptide repeat protein [Ignavibacteriales bacterium]